jgi:hypothetical protein
MVEGNPDDPPAVLNLAEQRPPHAARHDRDGLDLGREGEGGSTSRATARGPPDGIGDQLFSRFVRGNGPRRPRRHGGTGLGLAIVKAVTASHGGRAESGRSNHGESGSGRFAALGRLRRCRQFFSAQPPYVRTDETPPGEATPAIRRALIGQFV